jgi:hypothetical protein
MNWQIYYADGAEAREEYNAMSFDVAVALKPVRQVGFIDPETLNEYRVDVPPGATPFARRRRKVDFSPESGEILGEAIVAHILGWQYPAATPSVPGQSEQYLFILPDGKTFETDTLEPRLKEEI